MGIVASLHQLMCRFLLVEPTVLSRSSKHLLCLFMLMTMKKIVNFELDPNQNVG